MPANNLASQFLGGYKALNAALRKCRHCLAVKDTMESQVKANIICVRSFVFYFDLEMLVSCRLISAEE